MDDEHRFVAQSGKELSSLWERLSRTRDADQEASGRADNLLDEISKS